MSDRIIRPTSTIRRAVFLLLILAFSLSGRSQEARIEPSLWKDLQRGEQQLILVFESRADLTHVDALLPKHEKGQRVYQALRQNALESRKEVVAYLQNRSIPFTDLWIFNGLALKADASLTMQLAGMKNVKAILPDPLISFAPPERAELLIERSDGEPTWGIKRILADSVWRLGFEGQGIVIGGQDTGYDWEHPALKKTYRGWDGETADHSYNWHDAIHEISPLNGDSINPCGLSVTEPCDDNGHGTHTMGTMTGGVLEGFQIGVAPAAQWIGCRCMERGYGSPSTYIECFQWFLAPTDSEGLNPDPSKAPDVINNSWSCPELEGCIPENYAIMEEVIGVLTAAGIVVVVSAGNSGSACSTISTPPAIFDESFSVGAIRINDTIAGFSSRGPITADSSFRIAPDMVAPGAQVFSALPDSGFASFSGTSMSGPHVAAAVALLLSAAPELKGQVETIEQLLTSTTRPMFTDQECGGTPGTAYPNNTYGYGILNALDAVNAALTLSSNPEPMPDRTIEIYPNPATSTIYWRGIEGTVGTISILDHLGRELTAIEVDKWTDHLILPAHLRSGMYFLAFVTQTGSTTAKVIVSR